MIPPAIRLTALQKSFGSKHAVRDLHLTVPRGALYGIIGPNGAGKTTTLRMILAILFPDAGRVEVLGEASALQAKDRIGYLPEERGVYRKMTVEGFLQHMGILKGVPRRRTRAVIGEWLERVALPDVGGRRCEELSKGMQQKIQFIAAVIHAPELVILDEPFSGLDPVNMRLLKELIVGQRERGATVLFSTHVMPQAEQLCDHIVMIHDGRKVLDDPLSTIRARHAPRALHLAPLEPSTDVADALRGTAGIGRIAAVDGAYRIDLDPAANVADAVQAVAAKVAPARLELIRPSLEDVFVDIVRGSSRAAAEADA